MTFPPERQQFPQQEDNSQLKEEIRTIETELKEVQRKVEDFTRLIHIKLDPEISRINELKALYKELKRQKKEKRLEQKKRGKNYQEPTGLITNSASNRSLTPAKETDAQLRKIYKEAIARFHPDKISHTAKEEAIERANAITKELNRIYQEGDLDELVDFYQAILEGQPVLESGIKATVQVQDKAYLTKKKRSLEEQLEQLKQSYLYQVLLTYKNPLLFIEELQAQFLVRIKVLEKRTRKAVYK